LNPSDFEYVVPFLGFDLPCHAETLLDVVSCHDRAGLGSGRSVILAHDGVGIRIDDFQEGSASLLLNRCSTGPLKIHRRRQCY
jgi:hypothetical protein